MSTRQRRVSTRVEGAAPRTSPTATSSPPPELPARRVTVFLQPAPPVCEHCSQSTAWRTMRGLGPICWPCFERFTSLPNCHPTRALACGCTGVTERCPFAKALRQRIRYVESLALDHRGEDRAARYWRLHTQLVLAARRHLTERQQSVGVR